MRDFHFERLAIGDHVDERTGSQGKQHDHADLLRFGEDNVAVEVAGIGHRAFHAAAGFDGHLDPGGQALDGVIAVGSLFQELVEAAVEDDIGKTGLDDAVGMGKQSTERKASGQSRSQREQSRGEGLSYPHGHKP